MALLVRGLDLGLRFDRPLLHTTFASQQFPPLVTSRTVIGSRCIC